MHTRLQKRGRSAFSSCFNDASGWITPSNPLSRCPKSPLSLKLWSDVLGMGRVSRTNVMLLPTGTDVCISRSNLLLDFTVSEIREITDLIRPMKRRKHWKNIPLLGDGSNIDKAVANANTVVDDCFRILMVSAHRGGNHSLFSHHCSEHAHYSIAIRYGFS